MVDRARRLVLALSVLAALPLACQLVAGIEPVPKEKASSDGGVEGGGPAASKDSCGHFRPQPPPAKDDDRDGVLPPFYLAVRTLSTRTSGTIAGFDLDGVCTCDKRPNSAHQGGSSCTPKADDCDEDGGVDNKGTKLFDTLAPTGFSVEQLVNEGIGDGSKGLILYISSYNGKANDSEVFVGAMVSRGIRDGSGCGGSPNGFGFTPPKWCGHDIWTYSTEYVKPGTKEPASTANAYVTDNVLVVQGDLPITMLFGTTTLNFGSPITAGRLQKRPDGFWKLEGILAGRMPIDELLAAVGTFTDPTKAGARLCRSTFFATVKTALCSSVDINHSSRFDFKEGPCDAVSSAVSFTAEQVDIGALYDNPDQENDCSVKKAPAGTYVCP